MRISCSSIIENRRGAAVAEFAIILPFFIFLLIGSAELSRFILINQKLEATSTTMADLATQGSNISRTSLQQIANAAAIMMNPYAANTSVVFSSASGSCNRRGRVRGNGRGGRGGRNDHACITWQYEPMGGDASRIGSTGSVPNLPNNYTVAVNQNVIVAETFYHFTPLFTITASLIPSLGSRTLYYPALYKPRQGSLTTLD